MSAIVRPFPAVTSDIQPGLWARLRHWLDAHVHSGCATSRQAPEQPCSRKSLAPASNARLLPFPIRGEALLVQLADHLRVRVGRRHWVHDPFLPALSRDPHSRLTIDRDTYVEFDPRCATYRVVLDAAPEMRLTIETLDFETVVDFVAQYVADRLSDAAPLEVAS